MALQGGTPGSNPTSHCDLLPQDHSYEQLPEKGKAFCFSRHARGQVFGQERVMGPEGTSSTTGVQAYRDSVRAEHMQESSAKEPWEPVGLLPSPGVGLRDREMQHSMEGQPQTGHI